ncbi:hypothetical protein EJP77_09065 [Paenibacillus zeisoli]|uniref:DUF5018 domain-containing protein n=1 Tax=Paenibacillus zeisoli TaxID=2496267 RepID=A0A433XBM8_9BACL|nr:hypothetical protein EJP77_09065 [Paenibacillus zeisoli]
MISSCFSLLHYDNTAMAATDTISFSGPQSDVFGSDGIATDGEGGSTDISGKNIQVYGINPDGSQMSIGGMYYFDGNIHNWDNYLPLITWYDFTDKPNYGLAVKSADGSNFKLSSVNFLDWGNFDGDIYAIEAFKDGISQGRVTFLGNDSMNYVALDHTSILNTNFDNIDEFRIYRSIGTPDSYVALNDIVITDPVAPLSTTKAITAFDFGALSVTGTVDEAAKTVALTVPYGTDVTSLTPTITHTGVSISPNSGVAQDFSSPVTYTVKAEDNSTQTYTVTVTIAPNPAKAITAFDFGTLNVTGTVNEAAKTVAVTVPYGTDVTNLVPTITHTGVSISPNSGAAQDFSSPVVYTVKAADNSTQTYTVTVTVAPNPAKAIIAFDFGALSVTGTVDEAAKTVALTVPYGTDVTSLTPTITHTGVSISPNSGVAQDFSSPVTYTVKAEDNSTQTYTVTVTIAPNPAKAITAFDFGTLNVTGTVNEAAKTVAVTVPYGTDVTNLVPTITHTGVSISPNSGAAQDFSSPVVYTVKAADNSTQTYTVTVTVAPNPAKAIIAFDFGALSVTGTVDEAAKTVALTVPYGTDVTSLVPTITHTGVSISPNSGPRRRTR